MNYLILLILVMYLTLSIPNVIRNKGDCNGMSVPNNGTGNGTYSHCPAFSQLICPTKCDPSCKQPLIKRSMCRQPITCPKRDCVCAPDYVKNNGSHCIARERCSENCPSDEIFKLCPPSCEIHCGNVDKPAKNCPEDEREDHECIAGCICPTSFIRDYATGKCVKKENCSQNSAISCAPNEEYRNCSPVCDQICNKQNQFCDPNEKCKSGCFCKPGYIRQNFNALCIPEDNCFVILKDTDEQQTVVEQQKTDLKSITKTN